MQTKQIREKIQSFEQKYGATQWRRDGYRVSELLDRIDKGGWFLWRYFYLDPLLKKIIREFDEFQSEWIITYDILNGIKTDYVEALICIKLANGLLKKCSCLESVLIVKDHVTKLQVIFTTPSDTWGPDIKEWLTVSNRPGPNGN